MTITTVTITTVTTVTFTTVSITTVAITTVTIQGSRIDVFRKYIGPLNVSKYYFYYAKPWY